MDLKIILFMIVFIVGANSHSHEELKNPAFDPMFYEEVLNSEECEKQLDYLKDNPFLALHFIDASAKLPQGMLGGNLLSFGSFHQCLSLNFEAKNMMINGKYCSILVEAGDVINQILKTDIKDSTSGNGTQIDAKKPELKSPLKELKLAYETDKMIKELTSRLNEGETFSDIFNEQLKRDENFSNDFNIAVRLGICMPKPCSTHQLFNSSLLNVLGFSSETVFTEDFCRLPNDKPWSPADTFAAIIFSFIGILTLVCTGYDLIYKFILKKDVKDISSHIQTFSAYTNGCRLVNFNSGPGTLRCLDGIRVLATLWVVLGHSTHTQEKYLNVMNALLWIRSSEAVIITTAPMTVDTFFTMAGMLLVYTTCGKTSAVQFLKKIPLFYLNRLVRMFPLLATVVLLQASFFHRLSDGPMWKIEAAQTNNCRSHWWITLLHLQNFIHNFDKCLGHSWYIAIDVHLHIISPLILFWVLKTSKRTAWMALTAGLLVSLIPATIYNFNNNFVANNMPPPERIDEMLDYMKYYYMNLLTRASPFVVGMAFGYLLHIYRGKKIRLPWLSVAVLWSCSVAILISMFFIAYFVVQEGWDHRILDNMLNSFMRPVWGMAIGWMVFACVHGYGGPVNWFLSLDMWRLPARLCYGVYLFHYPLMTVVSDSVTSPVYFSTPRYMFMFVAYATISFFVSYFATLLIDVPFTTMWKRMIETRKK